MFLKFYNLLILGKRYMNRSWTWLLEQVCCLLKKVMRSIQYALTRYRFRLSCWTQVQMARLTMCLERGLLRTVRFLLPMSVLKLVSDLQKLLQHSQKLSVKFWKSFVKITKSAMKNAMTILLSILPTKK